MVSRGRLLANLPIHRRIPGPDDPLRGGVANLALAIETDVVGAAESAWLHAVRQQRWWSYEATLKRALDIVLSLLGLVSTFPLLLAIAIVIRIESPGSPFFAQERVGLGGQRFRFYKFRSMYADAEQRRAEILALNEADGPVFKLRHDPRITRLGRLLRRTSLDELPQLYNVLKGEMSLVGPRPPLPGEVELYRPEDALRLTVKPGITCWWQVSGRSDCSFEQWMEYDREYIRSISLGVDLRILLRTVTAVLSCAGAY
ncbi:MAG: sugar transferase [Chloroflexi bacterium]|nr:MAG: sugar transferase [Chloroflexota bacterium]TMD52497.1 MAG: sugar transferase [Chloroflexota bacterium]